MSLREVIQLPHARVVVEARDTHLFLLEEGELRSVDEVDRYTRAVDRVIAKTRLKKGVIDARGEIGEPSKAVREAMWGWILAPDRGFNQVAFVLLSAMAVARVNMTALAQRAFVRAFESDFAAQRWLVRPRMSTGSFRPPSSRPPPMTAPPTRSDSPGLYSSSDVSSEDTRRRPPRASREVSRSGERPALGPDGKPRPPSAKSKGA